MRACTEGPSPSASPETRSKHEMTKSLSMSGSRMPWEAACPLAAAACACTLSCAATMRSHRSKTGAAKGSNAGPADSKILELKEEPRAQLWPLGAEMVKQGLDQARWRCPKPNAGRLYKPDSRRGIPVQGSNVRARHACCVVDTHSGCEACTLLAEPEDAQVRGFHQLHEQRKPVP